MVQMCIHSWTRRKLRQSLCSRLTCQTFWLTEFGQKGPWRTVQGPEGPLVVSFCYIHHMHAGSGAHSCYSKTTTMTTTTTTTTTNDYNNNIEIMLSLAGIRSVFSFSRFLKFRDQKLSLEGNNGLGASLVPSGCWLRLLLMWGCCCVCAVCVRCVCRVRGLSDGEQQQWSVQRGSGQRGSTQHPAGQHRGRRPVPERRSKGTTTTSDSNDCYQTR